MLLTSEQLGRTPDGKTRRMSSQDRSHESRGRGHPNAKETTFGTPGRRCESAILPHIAIAMIGVSESPEKIMLPALIPLGGQSECLPNWPTHVNSTQVWT